MTTAPLKSFSELRATLATLRRKAQRGQICLVTLCNRPVAVLKAFEGETGEQIPVTQFRQNLTKCWEAIDSGQVESYVLTYHSEPKAVFTRIDP